MNPLQPRHPIHTPGPKRQALAVICRAHPGTTCIAQCERIRAALAQFAITTYEAMRHLDVYDPRARVMQLRNDGEAIATHWQTITTESGDRHRVGLYALAGRTVKDDFGTVYDHRPLNTKNE
jgi:hypothetical protein